MANHCTAALLLIASLLMVVALSGADVVYVIFPPVQLAGANSDAHGLDAAVTAAADPECDTCGETKPAPPPPCGDCEEPPKMPEPPCNDNCEEPKEAEMTCNKVHAVQEGETCDSVVQCAELSQDDFLRFNPNICCDKLFVGQWVCLEACDA